MKLQILGIVLGIFLGTVSAIGVAAYSFDPPLCHYQLK